LRGIFNTVTSSLNLKFGTLALKEWQPNLCMYYKGQGCKNLI
jgi:hypothetical protein